MRGKERAAEEDIMENTFGRGKTVTARARVVAEYGEARRQCGSQLQRRPCLLIAEARL